MYEGLTHKGRILWLTEHTLNTAMYYAQQLGDKELENKIKELIKGVKIEQEKESKKSSSSRAG